MELIEPNEFNAYTRMFNLSTDQNRLIVDLHGTVNHPRKNNVPNLFIGTPQQEAVVMQQLLCQTHQVTEVLFPDWNHAQFPYPNMYQPPVCNFPNQSQRT